jgi:hypothetical protein
MFRALFRTPIRRKPSENFAGRERGTPFQRNPTLSPPNPHEGGPTGAAGGLSSIRPRCDHLSGAPAASESAPRESAGRRQSLRPTLLFILVAGALILFYRKYDSFLNPQFWAEDGKVFFLDAALDGSKSLLKPYAGSLYLFQRSIAYAGNLVPVRHLPLYYNLTALLATLAVMAYVALSRTRIPKKWLLAIAVVASPHSGEVFMNLTNVHWILALALLTFIVSEEPTNNWIKCGELVMVAVLCLTGPFGLLFLPLFVIRLLVRRSAYGALVLAVVLLCAACQFRCLNADRCPGAVDFQDPHWIGFFGNQLSGFLFLHRDLLGKFPNCGALLAVTCLLYGSLAARGLWRRDLAQLSFLGAGASVVLATAYGFRGFPAILSSPATAGARYFYIPAVCTVWAIVCGIGGARWETRVTAFLLVPITLASVVSFQCAPLPDLHWKESCRGLRGPAPCRVLINPAGWVIEYIPPKVVQEQQAVLPPSARR